VRFTEMILRMKSKPEYRAVFSSHAMLYRALHSISTSKYKQPVRRYILDLFSLQLDQATIQGLVAARKQLHASATHKPSSRVTNPRAFSIIGHRRHVHPDGDSDSSDDELGPPPPIPPPKAARTLRPMSRIVGFAENGARAW
jgi:rapamycin-insensitive companion of mTOR